VIARAEQRDLSARLALKLDFHLIESKFGGWEHALSNRHADGILFLRERIDVDQYQSPHSRCRSDLRHGRRTAMAGHSRQRFHTIGEIAFQAIS
jgi:hypothetical protein